MQDKERRFLIIETEQAISLFRIAGDSITIEPAIMIIPKPLSPMFWSIYENTVKEKPL